MKISGQIQRTWSTSVFMVCKEDVLSQRASSTFEDDCSFLGSKKRDGSKSVDVFWC